MHVFIDFSVAFRLNYLHFGNRTYYLLPHHT